jgi:hypothetical protein
MAASWMLASKIGRNSSGKSSGPRSSECHGGVSSACYIRSVDPKQEDLDLSDHLRTHLEPLLVAPTPRSSIKATNKNLSPVAQVDITARSQSQSDTVTTKSNSQPTAEAGAGDGLALTRPPTQRMNSIYTYLKNPARFPWATTYANPNPVDPRAQEPATNDNTESDVIVQAAETPPLLTAQPDARTRTLGTRTIFFMFITAVMFFLLGSLVRSLFGEHQDFFTILPHNSSIIEPEWQEMTRVVEIKIFKWHIVVALLRDRSR